MFSRLDAVVGLLILLTLIGVGVFSRKHNLQQNCQGDLVCFAQHWQQQIDSVGTQEAYQSFKETYKNHSFEQQHEYAHIFGELVYKNDSLDGIAVCDSSFSFGCYHAFFLKAIAERGLEIVPRLGEACEEFFGPAESSLGCVHGIGHGLGEYLGPEELQQQLDVCRTLNWNKPYLGCSGGVFMEYNFPTQTEGVFKTTLRPFDEKKPTYPCEMIDDRDKPSCYFEIPHYWESYRQGQYQQMMEWCDLAESTNLKKSCIKGVGRMILPRNNFDVEQSIRLCQELETQYQRTLCLAGLTWESYAMPELQQASFTICDEVPLHQQQLCRDEADIIGVMYEKDQL